MNQTTVKIAPTVHEEKRHHEESDITRQWENICNT